MKAIPRKNRSSLFFSVVLVAALLIGFAVDSAQAQPKNIIICIGDGMGPQQVKAGGMYTYGAAGTLSFELFPYQGEITTYSANSGGPNSGATDSAAAATALATGYKVNDTVISVARPANDDYAYDAEMETLLEYFKDQGKMTGLVTTKFMTDATPAAFGAHDDSRYHTDDIADYYRTQTVPNVLFGGGGNGITTSEFSTAGYTVKTCWDTNRDNIEDSTGLKWLDTETAVKVLGYFNNTSMPYEYDGVGDLPHLSEMTGVALQILDNDPDGFFLMMEGGRIDSACHARQIYRADAEILEFHKAVQVVIDWAKGRTDTLILVVADHETGGLTVSTNGNNGAGNDPTVTWNATGSHTDANVGVYGWGINSELVSTTSDNTHIVNVVPADEPIELVRPVYDAVEVSTSPTLEVTVYDPDANDSSLDVTFYGREDSFIIVALPDTQYYVHDRDHPEIFDSQTQWTARNADALNIAFVTHEGDITESYDANETEWIDANNSMSLLDGIVPYGVLPGNHDKPTGYYNQYFPYTRYEDEYWYGGHYSSVGNENNYELFSAGGDDYIILHLENDPNASVINWAGDVLDHYTNRNAIITTHSYINTSANFVGGGNSIWNNLIDNRGNVHFVLCGHVSGERYNGRAANDGHTVHELLADYQNRSGHGEGWLRVMQFVPSANSVNVYTYSPWRDEYETDGNSEFTINNFDMSGGAFSVIGSETSVESGSNASTVWSGLSPETQYEWYASIDDPTSGTTQGPSYLFETAVYWYVDGINGDDANDGKTWNTAFKTISKAIDRAQDGHVIEVAEATYTESIDFAGKRIIVTSTDPEDSSVVASTIIDPNSDAVNTGRVVTFDDGEGASSVLTGFTITGGYAPGTGINSDGGGIFCYGSSPTISNCVITGNYAADDGGGIFCDNGSEAEISNCTVNDNEAGDRGGGMYCRDSNSTIRDCDVNSNDATMGGGLYYTASEPLVEDCTISDNESSGSGSAPDGGGIYCLSSNATIINCIISDNSTGDDGGGIFCDNGSEAEISSCTISGNDAGDKGGGMYCRDSNSIIKDSDVSSNDAGTGSGLYYTSCEPLVERCTISDNETTGGSSADGGGIYLLSSNATIISSIISDNISDDDAGGIYCLTGSDAEITNCTVSGNQADDKGGGIYCKSGSDPAITNCIVWGNTSTTGSQIHTATSTPVVSYSDVEGGWSGNYNINTDPAFKDAANSDYHLLSSSPCIDVGDPNANYDEQTDIDGDERVKDIVGKGDGIVDVDMGADEAGNVHNTTQDLWYFSIQTAINDANTIDVIEVEEGTYYETIDFGGKSITLTSTDPEDSSVVLNTIIDANSDVNNPGRGVTFDDSEGSTSVLTGFTITGGYAPGTGNARDGGGILCDGSSPTISNCIIKQNYAADDGGGIFCDSGSDATISVCTISDNESGDKGGAMYCRNSNPSIKICDITSNDAIIGGGLYFTASVPLIEHCIISDNETTGGSSSDGGGIYLLSSDANIISSVISDNISDDDAGGIYCLTGSSANISNCTLTGNQADDKGGGIYCKSSSDAVITNCILWGNTATTGSQIHTATSSPVVSYSDVQGSPVYPGTGNINTNPAFADAYHLLSSSPCIDVGDSGGNYFGQKDIDGEEREMGDEVDIGADEYRQ
jgi:alkaline phosphatase